MSAFRISIVDKVKGLLGYERWNHNIDQKELLKDPKVIFDIGANVGQTCTMYRRMYPSAQIWAFEPVPDSFSQLSTRFKKDPGIHPVQLALGDQQGAAIIHRGPASVSDSMLLRKNRSGKTIEVQTDTVDAFCDRYSIRAIDILKVDVEGMEARVFSGASAMFRRRAIRLVFTEVFFSPTYEGMPLFCDLHAVLTSASFVLYGLYSHTRGQGGQLDFANALYTLTN